MYVTLPHVALSIVTERLLYDPAWNPREYVDPKNAPATVTLPPPMTPPRRGVTDVTRGRGKTLRVMTRGGETEIPPRSVPPSSLATTLSEATPWYPGARVKESVPRWSSAGNTSNSPAISVVVVTVRCTTCPASSSYGPGRMSNTAGATVCTRPPSTLSSAASSRTALNDGGLLTCRISTENACDGPACPEGDTAFTVAYAMPERFGAGTASIVTSQSGNEAAPHAISKRGGSANSTASAGVSTVAMNVMCSPSSSSVSPERMRIARGTARLVLGSLASVMVRGVVMSKSGRDDAGVMISVNDLIVRSSPKKSSPPLSESEIVRLNRPLRFSRAVNDTRSSWPRAVGAIVSANSSNAAALSTWKIPDSVETLSSRNVSSCPRFAAETSVARRCSDSE
mmetsp:Transcript_50534/g.120257  ORF Transcript_50534/g.120257 Transcript_50534/m.120257 type:complete len:397 (-) Transcript_50534:1065-2255(-)